jgi:hypothetical protein
MMHPCSRQPKHPCWVPAAVKFPHSSQYEGTSHPLVGGSLGVLGGVFARCCSLPAQIAPSPQDSLLHASGRAACRRNDDLLGTY